MQFVKPGSRPVTLSCVFPRVVPVQAGSGSPPPAAIQPVTELLSKFFAFLFFKDVYIWSQKAKICKLKNILKDLCYRL